MTRSYSKNLWFPKSMTSFIQGKGYYSYSIVQGPSTPVVVGACSFQETS